MTDVRWNQRLNNYTAALAQLAEAVELARHRELSNIEKQGLIKTFEFTHELAWNVLKDYLAFQGAVGLIGSRDATRSAFKVGIIADGETWMDMIKSRNQTTHAYNQVTADQIARQIVGTYYDAFEALRDHMENLKANERD